MFRVRLRPTLKPDGAAKTISESGPTLTVIVPVTAEPPADVIGMLKVVSPEVAAALGVRVKAQLLPVCETEAILLASTPVASPQEIA